uniref:Uncharacterized protein n=1 Tax=Oryza rufipogon TaxID=4529 RepID=A0A0E0MRP6_ORYRU
MGMSQEQRVRLSVGLLVASSSRSSSITTTRAPGVRGNNDWNQTANMKPTVNPKPEKKNKRITPTQC